MNERDFCTKQAELLNKVPPELRGPLSYLAYEKGHAAGREEIISILTDLIDTLEGPLKELEERLRTEY